MSISLEEYRESVLVLHVVPGRGKTGQAHRGPARWLIADSDGLCALRTEAARVYCANGFEGDPEAKPKADWVNGFVAAVKDAGMVRLPARLYAMLAERVVARLTDGVLFPGLQARAIPAVRAKTDFGDLDVLVMHQEPGGVLTRRAGRRSRPRFNRHAW